MTDRGPIGDTELVFLSQSPSDHHQVVLAKGRPADVGFTTVNQISFKLASLPQLQAMHADLVQRSVKELVTVSHGNAWSAYFKDPEGNRIEVFVDTPWYTPQPCREPLDLTQSAEQIVKETEAYCRSRARFASEAEWRRGLADRIAASR
jgi:catechol-2,3-dioxygenase